MNPYTNNTSIIVHLSFYLFIIIILFIVINLYLILNYKKNGNNIGNIYDYRVFLFGDHLNFLKVNIKSLIEPSINDKKNEIIQKIETQKEILNPVNNDIDDLSKKILEKNVETVLKYDEEIMKMKKTENEYSETLRDLDKIQRKNIKKIDEIKQNYTMRIRNYVDSMVKYMGFINHQYNMALVTEDLNKLIDPLKNLFYSIGNGLKENVEFINQYYPSFNMNKVPTKIDSVIDGQQDLKAPDLYKNKPPP